MDLGEVLVGVGCDDGGANLGNEGAKEGSGRTIREEAALTGDEDECLRDDGEGLWSWWSLMSCGCLTVRS